MLELTLCSCPPWIPNTPQGRPPCHWAPVVPSSQSLGLSPSQDRSRSLPWTRASQPEWMENEEWTRIIFYMLDFVVYTEVFVFGPVTFVHMYSINIIIIISLTWSILRWGSGDMTVLAEKFTLFPERLPRKRPCLPFSLWMIPFIGFDLCNANDSTIVGDYEIIICFNNKYIIIDYPNQNRFQVNY